MAMGKGSLTSIRVSGWPLPIMAARVDAHDCTAQAEKNRGQAFQQGGTIKVSAGAVEKGNGVQVQFFRRRRCLEHALKLATVSSGDAEEIDDHGKGLPRSGEW